MSSRQSHRVRAVAPPERSGERLGDYIGLETAPPPCSGVIHIWGAGHPLLSMLGLAQEVCDYEWGKYIFIFQVEVIIPFYLGACITPQFHQQCL